MPEATSPQDPEDWSLRPMTEADLESVTANERAVHPDPWSRSLFGASLEHGHYCCVLERRGDLWGHAVLDVAAGEAELLNLCIHPAYWRQGLGRALLRHLLSLAQDAGAEDVFLEVRISNHRAIGLYEGEGFTRVGTRPDYYPGAQGTEDALVMARSLRLAVAPSPFGSP